MVADTIYLRLDIGIYRQRLPWNSNENRDPIFRICIHTLRDDISNFPVITRDSNVAIIKSEDKAYDRRPSLVKTRRNTAFRFRNIEDAEKTTLLGQGVDEGLPDLLRAS